MTKSKSRFDRFWKDTSFEAEAFYLEDPCFYVTEGLEDVKLEISKMLAMASGCTVVVLII